MWKNGDVRANTLIALITTINPGEMFADFFEKVFDYIFDNIFKNVVDDISVLTSS